MPRIPALDSSGGTGSAGVPGPPPPRPLSPATADIATLFAHSARVAMLLLLDREEEASAGHLAATAGVTPQAATFHLRTLRRVGAVTIRRRGRLTMYRLASAPVASAVRALAGAVTLPSDPADRIARTCYHHLGGRLAVALMDSMHGARWLLGEHEGFRPTVRGRSELRSLGVNLGGPATDLRPIVRLCMDRTERRWHIGGRLGIRLADRLFQLGWIERVPESRAVTVTPTGAQRLAQTFPSLNFPPGGLNPAPPSSVVPLVAPPHGRG